MKKTFTSFLALMLFFLISGCQKDNHTTELSNPESQMDRTNNLKEKSDELEITKEEEAEKTKKRIEARAIQDAKDQLMAPEYSGGI